MWNEKIGRKRVHNAGRWSLAVYKFICMRIKRNVNAITRAICEHVKEHLSMKMWRGYVTNTRRLTIIFALVDGLVVCTNWRLMENVQDIERLLALGPNVIESTTITKVNCCYILTRIMGGFIVCSIILLVASCVLTLCNLDKYLITINNNRFDHLQRSRRSNFSWEDFQNVGKFIVYIRYARTLENNCQIFPWISNWNFCDWRLFMK